MTKDRGPADQRIVDEFLVDSGETASEELRGFLLELRAKNPATVPPPCAELQQLFVPHNVTVLNDRRHRRRTVITAIAVVASMGLGATGVAALSPEFRAVAGDVVSRLFTPAPAGNKPVDNAERESAILPAPDPLKSRTLPENVPDKAADQVEENVDDRAARPESVRRNSTAPGKRVSEAAKTGVPGQSVVRGNSAEVRTVPELPAAVPADSPARVRTLIPVEKTVPAQRQSVPAGAADKAGDKGPAAEIPPNRPSRSLGSVQQRPEEPKAK